MTWKEDKRTIEEIEDELLREYRENVLPLLLKLEQNAVDGKRPINCQNEIRALFDHLSRCYMDNVTENEVRKELDNADSHMRRLRLDCYKELEMYYFDMAQKIYDEPAEDDEDSGFCPQFITFDNGEFWSKFCDYREKALMYVSRAKRFETINTEKAYENYETMLTAYLEMKQLLYDYYDDLRKCREEAKAQQACSLKVQIKNAVVSNWKSSVAATVISLVVITLCKAHQAEIWNVLQSVFSSLPHN